MLTIKDLKTVKKCTYVHELPYNVIRDLLDYVRSFGYNEVRFLNERLADVFDDAYLAEKYSKYHWNTNPILVYGYTDFKDIYHSYEAYDYEEVNLLWSFINETWDIIEYSFVDYDDSIVDYLTIANLRTFIDRHDDNDHIINGISESALALLQYMEA